MNLRILGPAGKGPPWNTAIQRRGFPVILNDLILNRIGNLQSQDLPHPKAKY